MNQAIGTIIYRMSRSTNGDPCIHATQIPSSPADPGHMHASKRGLAAAEILLQNASGVKVHCEVYDPGDVIDGSKDFWLPIGAIEELRIKTYIGNGKGCDQNDPNGPKCWALEVRHFGMQDANTRIEPCKHVDGRGDHSEIVIEC